MTTQSDEGPQFDMNEFELDKHEFIKPYMIDKYFVIEVEGDKFVYINKWSMREPSPPSKPVTAALEDYSIEELHAFMLFRDELMNFLESE